MAAMLAPRWSWVALSAVWLAACDGCAGPTAPAGEDASAPTGMDLTPEQAARVLATVGDRQITLGDYVTALERMDRFERLNYQTPQRRKLLLDEMIHVELLAREAERRGLDKTPETQAHIHQILRDEVVNELRAKLPPLSELPREEVRAYYEEHRDEFHDPERRRVAVLIASTEAAAKKQLAAVLGQDAKTWGEVARAQRKTSSREHETPLEFEGDLGLVSAPGEERGGNKLVPEPVRAALFTLKAQGDVYPEVVEHAGSYYVVRLLGINAPRTRTLEEVDNVIRVHLLQQRLQAAQDAFDRELRATIPVQINQAAVDALKLPPAAGSGEPSRRHQ